MDDSEAWNAVARLLLGRSDELAEIRCASSLDEAAAAIREFAPTVVVSDVYLDPRVSLDSSGLEVCRLAREQDPSVGIIVCSGLGLAQIGREAIVDLDAEFLDKASLRPGKLLEIVLRVARERRARLTV